MEPNNPIANNNPPVVNPNFQQPTNPMSGSAQAGPAAPMNETPQQVPAPAQPYGVNMQIGQNVPKTPRYVKVLTKICLALGIITVVGTIFAAIGLVSGLFLSSQGTAMVSSLLIGAVYALVRQYGTILCIATLIAIFVAKNRYHIPVRKPVLITIFSMLMIYVPSVLISCF